MDIKNYNEAKKFYFDALGDYFFMDRNDPPSSFERYKSFNIPKEIEIKWNEEIKKEKKSKLIAETNMQWFIAYCDNLLMICYRTKDITGLVFINDILKKKEDKLDTFSCLLLIEAIFRYNFKDINLLETEKVLKNTLSVLKKLQKKQITISTDFYEKNGNKLDYLNDENIKKRILNDINKFSKIYEHILIKMLNN